MWWCWREGMVIAAAAAAAAAAAVVTEVAARHSLEVLTSSQSPKERAAAPDSWPFTHIWV